MQKKEVLVMFSNSRNSVLTVCDLLSHGLKARLITFNNGSLSGLDRPKKNVSMISKHFGEDNITFEGVYLIVPFQNRLSFILKYRPISELAKEYEHLLPSQATCLICKPAMYIAAIKYCKENNIQYLAEGAVESQSFFVEKECMIERYQSLCKKHGITLITPIFKLNDNWKNKMRLMLYGVDSKTYEMQCLWNSCSIKGISNEETESLCKFFDKELFQIANEIILEDDAFNKRIKFDKENKNVHSS